MTDIPVISCKNAIKSYSLIIQLAKQGKLNQYYDSERQVLEHFRFKELFVRRTKKTFMSFVSKKLIDHIVESGLNISQDVIRKRMQRAKFKLHFSDLRELWASRSVKYLRQPEIDFLQGRVSSSVFMRHYFNPAWITDLQKRAIKNSYELLIASTSISNIDDKYN